MNILRQVTLESARRKKDRSVTLTFNTQLEQTTEEFSQIDEVLGNAGLLYFKDSGQLTTEEVNELESVEIEVEGKTKSQRLRNVLYVLYEQTETEKSFTDFYAERMEQLITMIKQKLD